MLPLKLNTWFTKPRFIIRRRDKLLSNRSNSVDRTMEWRTSRKVRSFTHVMFSLPGTHSISGSIDGPAGWGRNNLRVMSRWASDKMRIHSSFSRRRNEVYDPRTLNDRSADETRSLRLSKGSGPPLLIPTSWSCSLCGKCDACISVFVFSVV
jgi:hypothetical protein